MLQKLFGYFTSWLDHIKSGNIFPVKRSREISPAESLDNSYTPTKRRKVLYDITQEESNQDMTTDTNFQSRFTKASYSGEFLPRFQQSSFSGNYQRVFDSSPEKELSSEPSQSQPQGNYYSSDQQTFYSENHSPDFNNFRTPSSTSSFLKENRRSPGSRFQKRAMYKKNFRPPLHCKSPAKQNKSSSEEVQFIGTIRKPTMSNSPISKPIVNVDLTSSSPSGSEKVNSIRNISTTRRLSFQQRKMSPKPQHPFSLSMNGGAMSHMEYSQVLGTFIKNSKKVEPSPPPQVNTPVAMFDLTSDGEGEENGIIDLTSNISKTPDNKRQIYVDLTNSSEQQTKSLKTRLKDDDIVDLSDSDETTNKRKSKDLVRLTKSMRDFQKSVVSRSSPSVITIEDKSDDEKLDTVYKRRVERVNSLGKNLKKIPVTGETWITDLNQTYAKKMEELDKDTKVAKKFVEGCKEINSTVFDKWLADRITKHCSITGFIIPVEEEESPFPEITPYMKELITEATRSAPLDDHVVTGFGYTLRKRDFFTMKGLNWLNDEVINFYMTLLMERSKENPKGLKVYAFNTFFYPKLIKQGYNTLRRWTRKVDIFAYDLIIIPVHLQMHWCLATINFKNKTIEYYDSMGHPNSECLRALLEYLKEEYMDKKKEEFSKEGWKLKFKDNIPKQKNGSDCGMFACTFAEYLCRGVTKFNFSQDDMPYFRDKMTYELLTSALMIK